MDDVAAVWELSEFSIPVPSVSTHAPQACGARLPFDAGKKRPGCVPGGFPQRYIFFVANRRFIWQAMSNGGRCWSLKYSKELANHYCQVIRLA